MADFPAASLGAVRVVPSTASAPASLPRDAYEARTRAKVSASVRERLAEAKRAYESAVIAALREINADGSTPHVVDIQHALDVSRATAYRYLQRLRGAESANA